ncbi:MAG: SAM-dependent chlorinase/fluorinase [Bdellovibrionales bacterium]|nr:SAM-dependent chlorinase/fluorinase [Bdellovibrionales bacterium]
MAVITFLTDFGSSDSYVAEMKGTALCLCPAATLIDITHSIPHADILRGAQVLAAAATTFPDRTVHIGVVDPGVGSNRRRILLEAEYETSTKTRLRAYFVGPDNGLFSLAVARARLVKAWHIRNMSLLAGTPAPTTFDGRDVFTPVGAQVAAGAKPDGLGTPVDYEQLVRLDLPLPIKGADDSLEGEIVYIDHFGNAVTNIPADAVPVDAGLLLLGANAEQLPRVVNYEQIEAGRCAVLINSMRRLEIAAHRSSAALLLNLQVGQLVRVQARK